MKNLVFFVVALFMLTLPSCSEEENLITQEKLSIIEEAETTSRSINAERKITCIGTCEAGEHPFGDDVCEAMLYDGDLGAIECPCADCNMIISSAVTTSSVSSENLRELSHYTPYFSTLLDNKYGSKKAVVYEIVLNDYNNAQTLSLAFRGENSSQKETLMYVRKKDDLGYFIGPTIEVDCSGGCDDENETCRERYDLSTGNPECTCEGSCKMKITPLKQG